jgi:hypothetical protein
MRAARRAGIAHGQVFRVRYDAHDLEHRVAALGESSSDGAAAEERARQRFVDHDHARTIDRVRGREGATGPQRDAEGTLPAGSRGATSARARASAPTPPSPRPALPRSDCGPCRSHDSPAARVHDEGSSTDASTACRVVIPRSAVSERVALCARSAAPVSNSDATATCTVTRTVRARAPPRSAASPCPRKTVASGRRSERTAGRRPVSSDAIAASPAAYAKTCQPRPASSKAPVQSERTTAGFRTSTPQRAAQAPTPPPRAPRFR